MFLFYYPTFFLQITIFSCASSEDKKIVISSGLYITAGQCAFANEAIERHWNDDKCICDFFSLSRILFFVWFGVYPRSSTGYIKMYDYMLHKNRRPFFVSNGKHYIPIILYTKYIIVFAFHFCFHSTTLFFCSFIFAPLDILQQPNEAAIDHRTIP